MDANEIEQCRREWEEAKKSDTGWAALRVYERWFYRLLLHARTGLAVEAGARPLPAYQRADAKGCPLCGYGPLEPFAVPDWNRCPKCGYARNGASEAGAVGVVSNPDPDDRR